MTVRKVKMAYNKRTGKVEYKLNDRPVSPLEESLLRKQKRSGVPYIPKRYPFSSVSAGVHPSQVPALSEELRKAGIPTDFTDDGDPIYTSPTHRAKYLKYMGFIETK